MKSPSVCFVSIPIYHLLAESADSRFCGGAELQQLLIGRELAARGHQVSYVTLDHGQGREQQLGRFRVLGAFGQGDGLPGVRFFHPRWTGLWSALRRADADIYYLRGAGFQLLPIVMYAKSAGKRVVFAGASDSDFDPKASNVKHDVYRTMYMMGLKFVDAVVAQNQIQASRVHALLGKTAPVIHNGLSDSPDRYSEAKDVLWVGNIRPSKSPERFVDLAAALPEHPFVMVGGLMGKTQYPVGPTTSDGTAASDMENIRYTGYQTPDEVRHQYGRAKVLINTSDVEGFPNTFLHAWSWGVPVLTFVDPDSLVANNRLGWVVGSPEEMKDVLGRVLSGELEYSPEHIAGFFRENLMTSRQADRYQAVFADIVGA